MNKLIHISSPVTIAATATVITIVTTTTIAIPAIDINININHLAPGIHPSLHLTSLHRTPFTMENGLFNLKVCEMFSPPSTHHPTCR